MTTNIPTYKDSAPVLYDELGALLHADLPVRERHTALRDLFRRVVEQSIADSTLTFIGLFAKVDYLMKEKKMPHNVCRLIHDTRRILDRIARLSEEEIRRSFPHDVKATALLVCHTSGLPIPEVLLHQLPRQNRKHGWGSFDEKCLRCIVRSWDDDCIIATEEQTDSDIHVCYSARNPYLTREGKGDWSYLRKILREGAQLGLVRIRIEEGILFPELIIFEPDLLINISTIASCFETYAESPFVNLISRISPAQNSAAIQLGNLAGQFLDDTVHGRETTFKDSCSHFFHQNPLAMAFCHDLTDEAKRMKFLDEAAFQKRNIERLIGEELPREVGGYEAGDVILEPTFFSEVLGIQGRLDFLLQGKDGRTVIIEQKSGKGAWVPREDPDYDPNVPVVAEKHWVQLLLYRALFIYEFSQYAESLSHIMLLYSKYSRGLISTAQSPELFLRAIRIRNLLAWCEIDYAEGGMGILEKMTPEKLNMKGCRGKLWTDYTRPQLQEMLDPILWASPLERAYYFRFLRFIQRETLLAKVGNRTKDDSGFAGKWLDTLEDKKAAGNIYDGLTIRDFACRGNAVRELWLTFAAAQETDTTNFRLGDIVVLYPYREGHVPNACAQMVHRASIADITADGIRLVLRNAQTNREVFDQTPDTRWAIEHDSLDASAGSLFRAMHSFLSAPKERRDLLLAQRRPTIDTSLDIRGSYGHFDTLVRHAKQNRDLFLIIGPPGTGKTSHGLVNLLNEELTDPNANVLLVSFTNRAVDEICSKLVEEGIDFLRIGPELSCEKAYRRHMLSQRVRSCANTGELRQLIRDTRVFCATTAALGGNIDLLSMKHFDLAIIDESSQILEPHLIGLLSAHQNGYPSIGRAVLIGDHKQLPAVVQQLPEESQVTEQELLDIHLTDCRLSLFERLLSLYRTPEGYDPRCVYMLTRQGRMHRDIAEFPNRAFYGGKLDIVPLDHQALPCSPVISDNGIVRLLTSHRIAFITAKEPKPTPSLKTNLTEAEMIAATALQIYRLTEGNFSPEQTLGIIVPYRNQIATVRQQISSLGIEPLSRITIDTVERYQGSQRDFILYGFTIRQPYQLNFLTSTSFFEDGAIIDRKLNVAMTRARLTLLLFGNPTLLEHSTVFHDLIEFTKSKDAYFDIPAESYCQGAF